MKRDTWLEVILSAIFKAVILVGVPMAALCVIPQPERFAPQVFGAWLLFFAVRRLVRMRGKVKG